MSSKKVEDVHTELIKKLLSDSGLVCVRSPRYSEESEEELGEEEEGEEEEEERVPEEHFQVEHYDILEELEGAEEISEIFPTPSLRRLIPERIRRIESCNRIKVLPEPFNTDINPNDIPRINYTAPKVYIDILAEMTGCKTYKSSLAEYWFLDTLANLLRRAQEDDLNKPTQAVVLLWFCEWIKEMQHFDAANRDRMMRRWRDNMLAAAKVLAEDHILPNPDEAGVFYKMRDHKEARDSISSKTIMPVPVKSGKSIMAPPVSANRVVEFKEFVFECALKDLTKIIHYIYDLFGTDFQYELVRSIFTSGPDYHQIQGPFQIELPKRFYSILKPKKEAKVKSPKGKDKAPATTKSKGKKEADTEEYLALMQLISLSNKEELEKEETEREEWNKRNTILPLNFAATPEFFEQYWPTPVAPPPPPTPPPVATPEPKKKGKK